MANKLPPIQIKDFLPEKTWYFDAATGRAYARGTLNERLRQIVWHAVMDSSPRSQDTVTFVNQVTNPHWQENPERAKREISVLLDSWYSNCTPIWASMSECLELFTKYALALDKIAKSLSQPEIQDLATSGQAQPNAVAAGASRS